MSARPNTNTDNYILSALVSVLENFCEYCKYHFNYNKQFIRWELRHVQISPLTTLFSSFFRIHFRFKFWHFIIKGCSPETEFPRHVTFLIFQYCYTFWKERIILYSIRYPMYMPKLEKGKENVFSWTYFPHSQSLHFLF